MEPSCSRPPRLEERLFLILVALLPIMQPLYADFLGHIVYSADLLFVLTAFAWLIALLTRRVRLRRSWFYLPLALYFGALVASTAASVDRRASAIKLLGEIYLIGLAVLTFNLVTTVPTMRRVAGAWLVGTAITVVASLAGIGLFYAGVREHEINWVLAGYGSLPPGNYPRSRGLFLNMNMLCNYLGISFFIALVAWSLGWLKPLGFRLQATGVWVVTGFTVSPGLGGLLLGTALWFALRVRGTSRRPLGRLALGAGCVSALAHVPSLRRSA
jgi:hypothetical protein